MIGPLLSFGSRILTFAKNNPFKTAIGVGTTGYIGSNIVTNKKVEPGIDNNTTTVTEQSTTDSNQQVHSEVTKNPTTHYKSKTVTTTVTKPNVHNDPVDNFVNDIYNIMSITEKLQNQYEEVISYYSKLNEEYSKKLDELLPAMMLFIGKTPLSSLTKEDLPTHVGNFLKYSTYQVGIQDVRDLIKGYYVLNTNGIDTSNLSPVDIIEAGRNPVLVSNVHEEILKGFDTISTVLQYKIKTNLDTIGKYRDLLKERTEMYWRFAEILRKATDDRLDYLLKEKEIKLKEQVAQSKVHRTGSSGKKGDVDTKLLQMATSKCKGEIDPDGTCIPKTFYQLKQLHQGK